MSARGTASPYYEQHKKLRGGLRIGYPYKVRGDEVHVAVENCDGVRVLKLDYDDALELLPGATMNFCGPTREHVQLKVWNPKQKAMAGMYLHRAIRGLGARSHGQVRFRNGDRTDFRRSNLRYVRGRS